MSLATNTRFGPYLLGESIGVGGMGEVYRATDTNLKRDVAIKVLPASFSADPDRLARFQREAEVLAALNHVNIAHIYGLERSGGVTALVMELVDGQTLAERLERGALPADEALNIALQIADALEAAHERGIVHRDLKPANIKLASNGVVKVLDFGIAKALDTKTISGPQAAQLTTPAMTEAGIVLGTAAYMSPEQARGKPVDQRADIWAFGCLLYEMLTGQLAFGGEDVTSTLARILERGADMTALPTTLTPELRQALKLCLQKDPKKRVADIRDVKLLLAGAFEIGAAGNSTATSTVVVTSRRGWTAFAVAVAVIAALTVPLLQHLRETAPPPPPETRLDIVTPATDAPTEFALSPDGRQIVFVASGAGGASQLWLRSLSTATAQPLTGTEGARNPFWAPDSRTIGFTTVSGLMRLDPGGGAPQLMAPLNAARGASWGADNTVVFTTGAGTALMRVSAGGGEATAVTSLAPQQQSHRYPHFLPDGRRFLFYIQSTPDIAGIYLGNLDGSAPVRLTLADSAGVFHPAGWLLWVRAGTLTAQRLEIEQATLIGDPLTLADGVADNTINSAALSVATTGLIAYRRGSGQGRQLIWVDRAGAVLGTLGDPDGNMESPRVSPDGRRVVLHRGVQNNTDLWLLDGTRTSRFTFDAAADTFATWSPDGSSIAFRSNRTGATDIYQKLASGAGTDELLVGSDVADTPTSWSADGRFLLYQHNGTGTSVDLWAVPTDGDHTPFLFLQTPFVEVWGAFSPDSRWVAYQSNESGRYEIYVRAFVPPGLEAAPESGAAMASGGQWQVSTTGGIYPTWSPDGRELYYLNEAGEMMAVPITATADAFEPGTPAALFSTRVFGGGTDSGIGRQYDVAPDGRFLINTVLDDVDDPITLIQNWNPEAAQ